MVLAQQTRCEVVGGGNGGETNLFDALDFDLDLLLPNDFLSPQHQFYGTSTGQKQGTAQQYMVPGQGQAVPVQHVKCESFYKAVPAENVVEHVVSHDDGIDPLLAMYPYPSECVPMDDMMYNWDTSADMVSCTSPVWSNGATELACSSGTDELSGDESLFDSFVAGPKDSAPQPVISPCATWSQNSSQPSQQKMLQQNRSKSNKGGRDASKATKLRAPQMKAAGEVELFESLARVANQATLRMTENSLNGTSQLAWLNPTEFHHDGEEVVVENDVNEDRGDKSGITPARKRRATSRKSFVSVISDSEKYVGDDDGDDEEEEDSFQEEKTCTTRKRKVGSTKSSKVSNAKVNPTKRLSPVDSNRPLDDEKLNQFLERVKESTSKTSKDEFECTFKDCKRKFLWKWAMEEHAATHMPEKGRIHRCSYCPKSFFTIGCLKSHLRIHTRKPYSYECKKCPKRYCTSEGLRLHTRNVHEVDKRWHCPSDDCEKSFVRQSDLRLHIIRIHSTERPYPCTREGCQKSFACYSELKRHLGSHLKAKNASKKK